MFPLLNYILLNLNALAKLSPRKLCYEIQPRLMNFASELTILQQYGCQLHLPLLHAVCSRHAYTTRPASGRQNLQADLTPHTLHHTPRKIDEMPHRNHHVSTTTIALLFILLFICLFPSLFNFVWTLPLALLGFERTPAYSSSSYATMSWFQKQITLPAKARGSYLITDQIVSALPEIRNYKVGLLNLFIQHTSCGLSLNENCRFDGSNRAYQILTSCSRPYRSCRHE